MGLDDGWGLPDALGCQPAQADGKWMGVIVSSHPAFPIIAFGFLNDAPVGDNRSLLVGNSPKDVRMGFVVHLERTHNGVGGGNGLPSHHSSWFPNLQQMG